jgi:hypothetical protein
MARDTALLEIFYTLRRLFNRDPSNREIFEFIQYNRTRVRHND